jgi:molybdopterin/thiamine biosynthesis adenylyltransferase
MTQQFDYDLAFSRNIGWFTELEQQILKTKKVAIAGMGGVGANHALTLARLGITKFHLSDFDEYACENTNRQAGANTATYNKKKLDVMSEMLKAVNPEVEVEEFPDGINESNIHEFLKGVDCYVDSLDFFAIEARKMVFRECTNKHIPATTAAPIGMGTAYLNFLPGKMTFEEYFRLTGHTENEQYLKFFLGLTPAALQRSYLVDPSTFDVAKKKGPSTIMGCMLASGVAGAQVAKILLNRGEVLNVPWGLHFDAYTNQFKKTWRPFGNNNPIQKLAYFIGKKRLLGKMAPLKEEKVEYSTIAEKVLNIARWAPSGDNTQTWQFELLADNKFIVWGNDTREHCVYDSDGHSSHLAHGILLETIDIAASNFQHTITIDYDLSTESNIKLTIELIKDASVKKSDLCNFIETRTVQRRAMGSRVLNSIEKEELEQSLPEGFSIQWFESFQEKLNIAKLNFCNAKTRLTMEEAYQTHKEIIDWHKQFSETKIPEQAVGVDWVTARLMQWMFKSWDRIKFVNTYLAGTVLPRIQLDFIPSLKSSAHFAIKAHSSPESIREYIDSGRAIQRFWLTSAKLGLGFQPEQTPVIFAKYLNKGIVFTRDEEVIKNAQKGKVMFEEIITESSNVVFLGRLGRGTPPKSRSLRKPLSELMVNNQLS